ncbi:replication initiator [Streptomyces sp. SID13031]|uniref:replication initiator n=1 Tax=Streptomyces sp. SID13031 TaxID=2706046 RepID=UPI0031B9EA1E
MYPECVTVRFHLRLRIPGDLGNTSPPERQARRPTEVQASTPSSGSTASIPPHPTASPHPTCRPTTRYFTRDPYSGRRHPIPFPVSADNPDALLIGWGTQLDVRPVRQAVHGVITATAVAGPRQIRDQGGRGHGALIRTAHRCQCPPLRRPAHPCRPIGRRLLETRMPSSDLNEAEAAKNSGRLSYRRLHRWAHILGFGGHFSTRSRQYSTIPKALRKARSSWVPVIKDTVETAHEGAAMQAAKLVGGEWFSQISPTDLTNENRPGGESASWPADPACGA